ncbi:MAG: phosphorylase [Clostridiales bacterium]|nr:phosphorylase [Clostridiales bacterium]
MYKDIIDGMKKYGSSEEDICISTLGVSKEKISETVIIAPWWKPSVFKNFEENASLISKSESSHPQIWEIEINNTKISWVRTGIGAPLIMDAILALGLTRCTQIIFVGSVGALSSNINIGDIVVPKYSICGDGASRYILNDSLDEKDVYGIKSYPDTSMNEALVSNSKRICKDKNVHFDTVTAFSIDTIFAQYAHVDEIIASGCDTIEMETAAGFSAAKLAGISMCALFSVSDNTVTKKSLISGRTKQEMDYRRKTRYEIFPEIIINTLK